jgi:hypothetical protein
MYSDDLKIGDALQSYFSKYHFADGGYHSKWFKIKVGPAFIPLPNIKARVDAVKVHDLHHILTEYTALLKGETEIGAWEIASGCGKYYVAWLLNFGSFFYGLIIFPRPVFSAFMRGRRCRTNLYYNTQYGPDLLNKTVGELRKLTGMDGQVKNTLMDYLFFATSSLISLGFAFIFLFVPCYFVCKIF